MLSGRLLIASDFDGTLSRLVLDPWRAGIISGAQRALRRLAATPSVSVALISGRTVPDLAARARIGGIRYHGDHGAEWAAARRGFRPAALRVEREPVDAATAAMAERLKVEVPRLVPEPWLALEDKGPALTFHFRSAPDPDAARIRVRAAVDSIDTAGQLDQPGGRRAWELRPHGATTKGVALARLIEENRPDTVFMLGDDRHDALAFDTLRAARHRGHIDGLAVAVVSPAAETHEIATHADLVLARPEETAKLLSLMARALAAREPR
jgi:trehalose 6-phosphate phosphatase